MDSMIDDGQCTRVTRPQRRAYRLTHLSAAKVGEDEHLLTLLSIADPHFLGNADPQVIFEKDPII